MSNNLHAADKPFVLCALNDLPDPGSRGFSLMFEGKPLEFFIVRRNDQVFAYLNSCPHTGGPLDWVPDQFLDGDAREIQCATHDARFRIADGFCHSGPCVGQFLQPLRVQVIDNDIVLVGTSNTESAGA